jgi:eukaryotic-like serine/threonine-protein kinase
MTLGLYPLRVPRAGDEPYPVNAYAARGLAYFDARRYADAEGDFTVVIDRKPDFLEGYVNRALARARQHRYADALADLDHVLTRRPDWTDVLFQRAEARKDAATGLPILEGPLLQAAADADHAAGMQSTPTSVRGWVSRARRQPDVAKAMTDIAEALALEPDSEDAFQHQAELWSERVPAAATTLAPAVHWQGQSKGIAALDTMLAHWPESVPDRAGRAVLLARIGRDADAIADVEAVLREMPDALKPEPLFVYQLAGAYALVLQRNQACKPKALDLLARAFREEPLLIRQVETDPELVPLHNDPEFLNVVRAANILGKRGD